MIRWELAHGAETGYLGGHMVCRIEDWLFYWSLSVQPAFPNSATRELDDELGGFQFKSKADAKKFAEDALREWLQDAGLVSAPWLRAKVDAYWHTRGGSPRAGGTA